MSKVNNNYNIYLVTKSNDLKIAICLIIKNENLYIRDFVEYHLKLGFDKIFIYDNNDIDGENPIDVLQDYINQGYVEITNVRGKTLMMNKSYENCYNSHWMEYDWIFYIDTDEFLYIKNKTPKEFISDKKFDKCNTVGINWIIYGDNDILYYDNRTVISKFTKPVNKNGDYHIKSFVKSRINPINNIRSHAHYVLNNPYACNSLGNKIKNKFNSRKPVNVENIHLKHFWCKSTEELINKIKNKRADVNVSLKSNIEEKVRIFFSFNKKTPEKLALINKAFNTNFS